MYLFAYFGEDISDIGGVLQKGRVYIIIEMYETGRDGRFSLDIK